MTDFAFDPPATVSLAIQGEDARFPVRRILCVGRNYAAHAAEMGGDASKEPPFFFMKPADAAFTAGVEDEAVAPYPTLTKNLHHEAELVVCIGTGGRDIAPDAALDHVFGYAAGVDLTRRDLQNEAKEARRPWDWSKGFDRSAPIGPIGRREVATDFSPTQGFIRLSVNDEVRQDADLAEQIWGVADTIAFASRGMELRAGDLIMTGTPAGVGALEKGDLVRCQIRGLPDLVVTIG